MSPRRPGARRVAVVGGGLAGITAALRCVDAGCDVVVHEAQPRLGGLTYSFRRRLLQDGPVDALWIDNGQHVFLRCCTAYQHLLHRLGVAHLATVQPRLTIPVRDEHGGSGAVRRARLPAPLHLAGSLLRYPWLDHAERLAFARAALALRAVDPAAAASDDSSFGAWLTSHGQTDRAIATLWDLVGVAALNAHADDASLALAATVFQQGLLSGAADGDVGWATVPLQQLHGDAAARALGGARVLLRSKVEALVPQEGRWLVVSPPGVETVDDVVLAVPPAAAERLLPPGAVDQPPGWSANLGAAPIVNLHLLVDRPVLRGPFLAGLSGPTSAMVHLWVFDRTAQSGLPPTSAWQLLAVSVSAAEHLVDEPATDLRRRLLPAVEAVLPGLRGATVLDAFVTREREATFRPAPGTAVLRPSSATRLPGLVLAGAWTATGWPSTMEGAVRSGDSAAAALLARPLNEAAGDTAADGRVVA